MRADIIVTKVNESTVFINARDEICIELNNFFAVYTDNYRFSPLYKQGKWDGKFRSYDFKTSHLPIGLLEHLKIFCKKSNYTIDIQFSIYNNISFEKFTTFIDSLNITDEKGNKLIPRDFQIAAAYDAVCEKHININSVTGSGKSLIIYLIVRWLLQIIDDKIFVIVPTVALVEQLVNDFKDYGWDDVEDYISRIYSGQKRMNNKSIMISTWQSLYQDEEYLADSVKVLIVDEAHGQSATSKAFSKIAKCCINAEYRIGLSGSMPNEKTADWMNVVGSCGYIKTYSTYRELQDKKQLSDLKIVIIFLEYPSSYRNWNLEQQLHYKKLIENIPFEDGKRKLIIEKYNKEVDTCHSLRVRNDFIRKLNQKLSGNSLTFFAKKGKHGYIIRDELYKIKDKKVFYVDGEEGNIAQIKKYMEDNDNCILLGSRVLVTGINIKRIHNIIFAYIGKSFTAVKQAIGRGLRLHETKEYLQLFDIVDDLRIKYKEDGKWKTYVNYSIKHAKDRILFYKSLGFEVEIKKIKLRENNE